MGEIRFSGSGKEVDDCLEQWRKERLGRRFWEKDPGLWQPGALPGESIPDLTDRLGWLDLPAVMAPRLPELEIFVHDVLAAGFTRVVVLGMGGSSLIAEVWSRVFGTRRGYLPVSVLDSTHPRAVAAFASSSELRHTLFLVASKSGGTLETLSFCNFFFDRLQRLGPHPGANFVALTDPGSKLEMLAREREFRRIFSTPQEVGGRFSALTWFGLLPAALLGLPLERLLESAAGMMQRCGPEVAETDNPALRLGAWLGRLADLGRDKLQLFLSPRLQPFAVWLEQLIAESTGKNGRGLLPVSQEAARDIVFLEREKIAADDRVCLFLRLDGDNNRDLDAARERVADLGLPLAEIRLGSLDELGGEIWRFEMATAAAAAVLGINPFDQPDVEAAKVAARQAMAARCGAGGGSAGNLPENDVLFVEGEWQARGSRHFSGLGNRIAGLMKLLSLARPGDYLAVLAYLPPGAELERFLSALKLLLQKKTGLPVTVGFGPRYLHSTGQLHKGDGNRGLFLQLLGELEEDLPLPGADYGFVDLITAQAHGDYQALVAAGRRILSLQCRSVSGILMVDELRKLLEQC